MRETKIREFLVSQSGQNMKIKKAMQRGFTRRAGETDELLEAEGMRIGAGREERVARLQNEGEPGGQGKRIKKGMLNAEAQRRGGEEWKGKL
jgi:hypothetical protein